MTTFIVEYTLRGDDGKTFQGRSAHEYNEHDATALADIWNGEKENGIPIIRCEIVGLEAKEDSKK